MAGALTVTLVGSYDTMELAVAAWDAGTDTSIEDTHQLFIEPGVGAARYHLVKVVRAQ